MGETGRFWYEVCGSLAFSILERIDVGETSPFEACRARPLITFSILERIDVGETIWSAT